MGGPRREVFIRQEENAGKINCAAFLSLEKPPDDCMKRGRLQHAHPSSDKKASIESESSTPHEIFKSHSGFEVAHKSFNEFRRQCDYRKNNVEIAFFCKQLHNASCAIRYVPSLYPTNEKVVCLSLPITRGAMKNVVTECTQPKARVSLLSPSPSHSFSITKHGS